MDKIGSWSVSSRGLLKIEVFINTLFIPECSRARSAERSTEAVFIRVCYIICVLATCVCLWFKII